MAHFFYKRYDWDASIRFILTRFHHRFIHIVLVLKPIPSIELTSTSEREKKKWKIHTSWALFAFYQMFRCMAMFGWNIFKAKPFLIFSPPTSTHPFLLPFTCFLPMWFFLYWIQCSTIQISITKLKWTISIFCFQLAATTEDCDINMRQQLEKWERMTLVHEQRIVLI